MNQLQQTKTILYEFVHILSENRKISIRYVLILLPAAICMGAVCFIDAGSDSQFMVKALQLILFMFAGFLHLYFLRQKISLFWFRFLGEGILYTAFAGLLIFISLLLFYLFAGKGLALLAMASSSAFVFPHIMLHSWNMFVTIPEKKFSVWIRPEISGNGDDILFPGHISVQLKITRKYFDVKEDLFFKTVPEQNKLGEVFFSVLQEENKKKKIGIEYFDEKRNLFGWEFYAERLGGFIKPRRLDPDLTLADNFLHENSVILVKRVRQSIIKTPAAAFFSKN